MVQFLLKDRRKYPRALGSQTKHKTCLHQSQGSLPDDRGRNKGRLFMRAGALASYGVVPRPPLGTVEAATASSRDLAAA